MAGNLFTMVDGASRFPESACGRFKVGHRKKNNTASVYTCNASAPMSAGLDFIDREKGRFPVMFKKI